MTINTTPKRTSALLAALLALTLTACGNKTDQGTAGAKIEPAPSATMGTSSTIGDKIDDATITASVSAGLAKDSELSAVKIDVDTKAGAVMLNGPAPTAAAKARAEEIAKSVKGVSSVDNKLEVKTM